MRLIGNDPLCSALFVSDPELYLKRLHDQFLKIQKQMPEIMPIPPSPITPDHVEVLTDIGRAFLERELKAEA